MYMVKPGIGQNVPCTLGDCLTCRPEGHRDLGSCGSRFIHVHVNYRYHVHIHVHMYMCTCVRFLTNCMHVQCTCSCSSKYTMYVGTVCVHVFYNSYTVHEHVHE